MHIYSYMAEICKKYAIAELSSHGGRCRTGVRRRSASALSLLRDRHLPPAARRPPEFACGLSSVFRLRNDRNPAPAAAIRSQPVSASPGRSTLSPLTLSGFESRAAHKKTTETVKRFPPLSRCKGCLRTSCAGRPRSIAASDFAAVERPPDVRLSRRSPSLGSNPAQRTKKQRKP